jgi:hypothetical protein
MTSNYKSSSSASQWYMVNEVICHPSLQKPTFHHSHILARDLHLVHYPTTYALNTFASLQI